jgi:hypothetical protein
MSNAVFLSAGVPDPKRGPDFAATADTVAIAAAVSALVHVTLGRRLLVWGGHPAITPMVSVMADDVGVEYGRWVRLYQSRFFEEEFPEDNIKFQNVTYTDAESNAATSLAVMRERMFTEHNFAAAVFIGGMHGIIDEYNLFRKLQPNAKAIPVASTGGAALNLAFASQSLPADLSNDLDYVALFHRHLEVSVKEERYRDPDEQPEVIDQRFWKSAPKVRPKARSKRSTSSRKTKR